MSAGSSNFAPCAASQRTVSSCPSSAASQIAVRPSNCDRVLTSVYCSACRQPSMSPAAAATPSFPIPVAEVM